VYLIEDQSYWVELYPDIEEEISKELSTEKGKGSGRLFLTRHMI
jgi:hypothetical protein